MGFLQYCVALLLLITTVVCQTTSPPATADAPNFACLNALRILVRPDSLRVLNIRDQRERYDYVTLSRHHIIPYATMRDFYNNLLVRDPRMFQRLFTEVISVAAQHAGLFLTDLRLRFEDYRLPNLQQLVEQHLQSRGSEVSQIQLIQEVYAWLPFNIYIGPSPDDRVDDDQANAFDSTASVIVGSPRALILNELYQAIVRYNTQNTNNPEAIIDSMGDLVHIAMMPYDFDPSQWRVVQGVNEYRFAAASDAVRTDPGFRELRSDDYCSLEDQAHHHHDSSDLKRDVSNTACIMLNNNNDTFCINSLDIIRASIIQGTLTYTKDGEYLSISLKETNSVVPTDRDPSIAKPVVSALIGLLLEIMTIGLSK